MLFVATAIIKLALQATTYEVTSIQREATFAGRLGDRIEETLQLERDGQTISVRLGRYHTFFGEPKKRFAKGDRVVIHTHVSNNGLVPRELISKL